MNSESAYKVSVQHSKHEPIGQDEVANVVPSDGHCLEFDSLTPFRLELDILKVCVHGDIDTWHSSVYKVRDLKL